MKNKYILPVSIVCILAYDKIVVFECLVEGFLTNTILQQLQFSLSLSLSVCLLIQFSLSLQAHLSILSKDLISLWWASSSRTDQRYRNISKDPILYLYTLVPVRKIHQLAHLLQTVYSCGVFLFPLVLTELVWTISFFFSYLLWNQSVLGKRKCEWWHILSSF